MDFAVVGVGPGFVSEILHHSCHNFLTGVERWPILELQVVVRCRPLNGTERNDKRAQIVSMDVRSGTISVSWPDCGLWARKSASSSFPRKIPSIVADTCGNYRSN